MKRPQRCCAGANTVHPSKGQTMSNDHIEYRDIDGAPGYMVGSDASVWSSLKTISMGWRYGLKRVAGGEWKQLVQATDTDGYKSVGIRRNGVNRQYHVHCLRLEAFVGPRPPGHIGRHKNDIKSDNRLENLAWGTQQDNANDRVRNGKITRGDDCQNAKLSEVDIPKIRLRRQRGETYAAISLDYGVNVGTIRHACVRLSWKHIP